MPDSKVADLTADTNPVASDYLYKVDSTGSNGSDRKVALNLVGGWSVVAHSTLGAGATSISLTSIPSTFESLMLVFHGRSDGVVTETNMQLRFNNDTGSTYDSQRNVTSATTNTGAENLTQTVAQIGFIPGSSATADRSGSIVLWCPGYARTVFNKTWLSQNIHTVGTASGTTRLRLAGGTWRSTSAINRIDLLVGDGNMIVGTSVTLYGLRGS